MGYPVNLKFHQTDFVGVSADLNDMEASGLYEYISGGVTYYLMVVKSRGGNVLQTRTNAATGAVASRVRTAGSWSAWATPIDGANIVVTGLPTADPEVAGQLWSDSGVLTVSAGS